MTSDAVMSPPFDQTRIKAAYAHCEAVVRGQARNFAYGITLLPGPKRRALSAVYAFARRVDDIGDGTLPAADKIAALDAARASVALIAADASAAGARAAGAGAAETSAVADAIADDLVLLALWDAARVFPIPVAAFGELIDGCEADVRGTRYATFADLEHYCRCVAGSIGRLSLGVFGSSDPRAAGPLADALGIALQVTNILRDIREDLDNGRVYLPAEDLARFGCALTPPGAEGAGSAVIAGPMPEVMRFEADRAREWYATGLRLIPLLDRRSAACTGAMAGIYRQLLEQIGAAPEVALGHRMSLPGRAKARIAVTALAGMARPVRTRPVHPAPSAGLPVQPAGLPVQPAGLPVQPVAADGTQPAAQARDSS
jgi:phytoene synthase